MSSRKITFFSCDPEFLSLIYNDDLDSVIVNQHVKHLSQSLLCSNTHTVEWTKGSTYTTKVVSIGNQCAQTYTYISVNTCWWQQKHKPVWFKL